MLSSDERSLDRYVINLRQTRVARTQYVHSTLRVTDSDPTRRRLGARPAGPYMRSMPTNYSHKSTNVGLTTVHEKDARPGSVHDERAVWRCRGAWYTWTDMYMFRQLRVAPEGISDRLIVVG